MEKCIATIEGGKKVELKKWTRLWCWWMSRNIYFMEKKGELYIFEDIADVVIKLDEKQVAKLREEATYPNTKQSRISR